MRLDCAIHRHPHTGIVSYAGLMLIRTMSRAPTVLVTATVRNL